MMHELTVECYSGVNGVKWTSRSQFAPGSAPSEGQSQLPPVRAFHLRPAPSSPIGSAARKPLLNVECDRRGRGPHIQQLLHRHFGFLHRSEIEALRIDWVQPSRLAYNLADFRGFQPSM